LAETSPAPGAALARRELLWLALAAGVEAVVTLLFAGGHTVAALLPHAALLVALALTLRLRLRRQADIRVPALLLVSTVAAGPFGAAGAILTVVTVWLSRSRGGTAEWFASLFPPSPEQDLEDAASSARAAIAAESDGEVMPLVDLLEHGDELQKQAVVSLVARSFRPSLAPLLRRALEDPSSAVRAQAATTIARIEGKFLERVVALRREIARDAATPDSILELARLFDDYAYTGLLDPEREHQNRQEALALYLDYLGRNPADTSVTVAVVRLLVRQRDYRAAASWLARLDPVQAATPQATMWRMEVAFHLGQWQDLRALARATAAAGTDGAEQTPALREVLALWQEVGS
jgi:hypothetical protein